jgi:hypothetical protein
MKGRKHNEAGGVNEAEEDLKSKPERYNESRVEDEAEERKYGGRTEHHRRKRKTGGHVKHHEEHEEHHEGHKPRRKRKHGGMAEGHEARHHAGRKPRKSGGSCEASPFSSARKGEFPKGRKMDGEVE